MIHAMTSWRELGQAMPAEVDWPVLVIPGAPEPDLGGLRAFLAGSIDAGQSGGLWRALPQFIFRHRPLCAVQRSNPRDLWIPLAELPECWSPVGGE